MASVETKNLIASGNKMTVGTKIYSSPELKREAGKVADREGLPLSEWIVRVVAERLGKPELGAIPRKKMGRPRKRSA